MRIGSLGLPELLIILLVVLLIFGPRRLPEMAKGLGNSVREFRKGVKDMKEDFEAEASDKGSKTASAEAPAQATVSAAPAAAEPVQAAAATEAAPAAEVDPSEGDDQAKGA